MANHITSYSFPTIYLPRREPILKLAISKIQNAGYRIYTLTKDDDGKRGNVHVYPSSILI